MMRRSCRVFVLVFYTVVANGSYRESAAIESTVEGTFLVSVFNCYMPVPSEFVLNTRETTRIMLFHKSLFDAMMITISDYQANLGENFSVIREHESQHLAVQDVENTIRKDIRVTRIHDKKQQVMVYGGDPELVDSLVQGCLSGDQGGRYPKD